MRGWRMKGTVSGDEDSRVRGEIRNAELESKFKGYRGSGIGVVDQHIQTPPLFPIHLLKQASYFTLLA